MDMTQSINPEGHFDSIFSQRRLVVSRIPTKDDWRLMGLPFLICSMSLQDSVRRPLPS